MALILTFLQGYEGHYTSPESGATIIRQFFYGADDQFITYKDVSYCLGIDDTSECDLFNSLSEIDSNDSFISNAYPNPSNGSVKFDYTISSVNESRIVILNSLGAEIERIELQESNGTASFSTDLLSNGIYTCLLHTNGNIVQSSRFIVD